MKNAREKEPRFGEAVTELEEILHRIESEEIDIDELAAELKKAAQLLELCRGKIRKAEVEVTQIVQTLDGAAESEDETTQTPASSDDGT